MRVLETTPQGRRQRTTDMMHLWTGMLRWTASLRMRVLETTPQGRPQLTVVGVPFFRAMTRAPQQRPAGDLIP